MCSQHLGPELQAVDSLPAVHLPEALLALHCQGTSQQHCQLADACNDMPIAVIHFRVNSVLSCTPLHPVARSHLDARHANLSLLLLLRVKGVLSCMPLHPVVRCHFVARHLPLLAVSSKVGAQTNATDATFLHVRAIMILVSDQLGSTLIERRRMSMLCNPAEPSLLLLTVEALLRNTASCPIITANLVLVQLSCMNTKR